MSLAASTSSSDRPLSPNAPREAISAASAAGGRVMSRVQGAAFVRELSTGLRAGLPLATALKTLARQGRTPAQREMILSLLAGVEAGKPLSEAMAKHPKTFSTLTTNLTRAGEASGRLGEVLNHAAMLLDKDVRLRRSILSATLYPAILALLVCAAVVVVVTFIVPNILRQIGSKAIALPWPTRVVQGVAGFFTHWWWLVLLGAAAGAVLLVRAMRDPASRLWIDTNLLRVPVLGNMLRDVAVARFTRTLATLTDAGIPIIQALNLTKGTLGNAAMENVIGEVGRAVSTGKTIADPLERSGMFPPMLVQLIHMGERSGRLPELLDQAAGAFEEKTEQSVKIFTMVLPPALVVVLAVVIGFVVWAILSALLTAQDAAMVG
jgi:type II secretory pathway component PulF